MKKIIGLFFLFSAMCCFVSAQSPLAEFDKAKEIKLLESTREDVKKILAEYKFDADEDEDSTQAFSTERATIIVTFSDGDCSDDSAYWNVAKETAVKIVIKPEEGLKSENFDFTNYKKEIEDEDSPEYYAYHDEKNGIAFEIDESEVQKIRIYPPDGKKGLLCDNDNTLEIVSGETRMVDALFRESGSGCYFANVTNLALSASELIINYNNLPKNKKRVNDKAKIFVTTTAVDPENDVLIYNYTVSAGKIVGAGANVVWDLSGVKAGVYTITAGVDDGCGVCGQTQTRSVTISQQNQPETEKNR